MKPKHATKADSIQAPQILLNDGAPYDTASYAEGMKLSKTTRKPFRSSPLAGPALIGYDLQPRLRRRRSLEKDLRP